MWLPWQDTCLECMTQHKPGMVVHYQNPITREAEAGRPVQVHPQLLAILSQPGLQMAVSKRNFKKIPVPYDLYSFISAPMRPHLKTSLLSVLFINIIDYHAQLVSAIVIKSFTKELSGIHSKFPKQIQNSTPSLLI